MKKFLIGALLAVTLTGLSGCTKSQSSGSSSGSGSNNGGSGDGQSDCGVLINGSLKDTVDLAETESVQVTNVLSVNSLAIRRTNQDGSSSGDLLFKILGIGSADVGKAEIALSSLKQIVGSGVLLRLPQEKSCFGTLVQGGSGEVGQFFTRSGDSVAEILIRRGLVKPETSGACGEAQLASCYTGLFGSSPDVAGPLDAFLWKPEADSDGKLAVHTGPYNTTVIVNGEVGRNQGAGNGYGSLARFTKSGCGYANPQIQVIDGSTGLAYTVGGQAVFTVPNPCGRHCLQGGAIVACSK